MSIQTKEYHKRWREKHKDRIREYYLRDYAKRRESIRIKRNNPEYRKKLSEYLKLWRAENLEANREAQRKWVQENKDWLRDYRKAYGERRRTLYAQQAERICARKRELAKTPNYRARVSAYQRHRRATDIDFALIGRIRATIDRAFRRAWVKKSKRSESLIGCTIGEYKAHIASQFEEGMSWENRSEWHVDHYVPLAAFDFRCPEEQLCACNWKNVRPLWGKENLHKSDTIPNPLPSWLPPHIADRINARRQARTASTSPFLTSLSFPVVSQSSGVPT